MPATGNHIAAPGPGPWQCALYVPLDNYTYAVDSLVKAVDVCFKVFFICNSEYPKQQVTPGLSYRRQYLE